MFINDSIAMIILLAIIIIVSILSVVVEAVS